MDSHAFEYYLTLLQVQMVILGFVVAGLVTLMQMLNTAIPKRSVRMLAHPAELIGYMAFLSTLVIVMGLATWATAFGHPTSILVEFFNDRLVAILLLIFSLGSLLWLVYLIYRTKRLLNAQAYLTHYISKTPPEAVLLYVTELYGGDIGDITTYDPFQPIREYIKHTAHEQYDYGTATGLKLFGRLFDKTFLSIKPGDGAKDTYTYLAKYYTDSAVDLFLVFHKVASEKRKLDVIRQLHKKAELFLNVDDHDSMLIIVKALEEIGSLSHDEDEIVDVIECIQDITNSYLASHKDAPWSEIAEEFEAICLSIARLAETYYLQHDKPMKSVTPISYYTGKTKNVSISLVTFLASFKDLADLRIEAQPKLYFEAIEALIEVLFAQIKDIRDSGKIAIGLNGQHHILTEKLYSIYYNFALEAIEHKRADLFGLSLGNLRRVIKSANQFKLDEERAALTTIIVELSLRAVSAMGDAPIKNDRLISTYALETLQKHVSSDEIEKALNAASNNAAIDFDNNDVRSLKTQLEARH